MIRLPAAWEKRTLWPPSKRSTVIGELISATSIDAFIDLSLMGREYTLP